MSVFTDKNGVWQRNSHLHGRSNLQMRPAGLTFGQGISPYLQLIRASRHGSASEQDGLANERNARSALTVINNSVKRGGYSGKKN